MATTETRRTLFDIGEDLAAIQAAIAEAGGELTPELEQKLAAAADALGDKVDAYGYRIRALQGYAEMHADRAKFHTLQAQAYTRIEGHLKAALLAVMQRLGTRKLVGTDFSAAVSETARAVVEDPSQLPQTERYWRVKAPEINLAAVREDLQHGVPVPGARLEPVPYVRLR